MHYCRGLIAVENKTFVIEPVSGHADGAHIIYHVEELKLAPGACGHSFNGSSAASQTHINQPFQAFHKRVRLQSGFLKCFFFNHYIDECYGIYQTFPIALTLAFFKWHEGLKDWKTGKQAIWNGSFECWGFDTHFAVRSPELRAQEGLADDLHRACAASICLQHPLHLIRRLILPQSKGVCLSKKSSFRS